MIDYPNTNPYFYYVDEEYINYLKEYEIDKRNFTCVPNVHYWNTNKFIFGAVLNVNGMLYFAPISSYSKKQINLILLKDKKGKVLGSVRLNYMIPVPKKCLHKLDINNLPTEQNRVHTSKELAFCRRNREKIYKLALKTYSRVTKGTDISLKNNSCDFKLLEQACKEYVLEFDLTDKSKYLQITSDELVTLKSTGFEFINGEEIIHTKNNDYILRLDSTKEKEVTKVLNNNRQNLHLK